MSISGVPIQSDWQSKSGRVLHLQVPGSLPPAGVNISVYEYLRNWFFACVGGATGCKVHCLLDKTFPGRKTRTPLIHESGRRGGFLLLIPNWHALLNT